MQAPTFNWDPYDLDLDGRNPRLEERALAEKLNSRRLRGAILVWKRHLEATAPAHDPVLAPWHAFAALAREGFAAKAALRLEIPAIVY